MDNVKDKDVEECVVDAKDSVLDETIYGYCPACGANLNNWEYPEYCGFCGKKIRWE